MGKYHNMPIIFWDFFFPNIEQLIIINSFSVEADVFLDVTMVYFNPCEGKSLP